MPGIYSITPGQITDAKVREYLAALQGTARPTPQQVESDLLNMICVEIDDHNTLRPKTAKMRMPQALPAAAVAHVVKALWPVAKIPCAGKETDPAYDILGLYQENGPDKGIYATSELVFRRLLRQFNFTASERDFKEFVGVLREIAERRQPCQDRDLIAVNNGIFDYKTKQLRPFDPGLVFLSKSRVSYVANPVNPVIHNPDDGTDWDVETWMAELSDDPEIVNLLWQILGAIIRPNVNWDKAAFFYSASGNNGKGTLCALMRNLCGPGTYASTSLSDFGKEFLLEPLMRASAIIVDENDVGNFKEKCANFKAIITNDVIQINRKYEKALAFQFHGFMVQCVNELPRMKDKSESLYRRLLFVPFEKCFTGKERKYIKADYLARPDVLEYVLFRILNTNYYELSNPTACQNLMADVKQNNDPLRQFIDEFFPVFVWDMVPLQFLYDLYVAWFKRYHTGGYVLGKQTFNTNIANLQSEIPGWTCVLPKKPGDGTRPDKSMKRPEPLIVEYNLDNWTNKSGLYAYNDPRRAVPALKQKYGGYFLRTGPAPASVTISPYGSKTA